MTPDRGQPLERVSVVFGLLWRTLTTETASQEQANRTEATERVGGNEPPTAEANRDRPTETEERASRLAWKYSLGSATRGNGNPPQVPHTGETGRNRGGKEKSPPPKQRRAHELPRGHGSRPQQPISAQTTTRRAREGERATRRKCPRV